MKASKWYLIQEQTQSGYYALIKEKETELIIAELVWGRKGGSLRLRCEFTAHKKLAK